MFNIGKWVAVADGADCRFGRVGRVVSTVDPDVAIVEFPDAPPGQRFDMVGQQNLASAQGFSRIKWRAISKMRFNALMDWALKRHPPVIFGR